MHAVYLSRHSNGDAGKLKMAQNIVTQFLYRQVVIKILQAQHAVSLELVIEVLTQKAARNNRRRKERA